ncbi:recombinase family protein [Limobrevibacterium gyesilva]|uniref:recombinase family protein n=1 Tax=Limobrevibacterium gyesilva TaxID=2991712 RepID=UPI0038D20A8F
MTQRAAVYARYSSDNQREASIEDQVRICRARAEREGWVVTEVYADYAISGATADRPQFQALMAAARSGRFDIVLAEALDRLSRDQEHIAGLYKQLSFAGVRLVTIADGDVTELHVGLKGTMAAMFLKDLAQKTHRGIEGRVRAGASGGGLSFGYRVLRQFRADGTPTAGEMEIVPEEAELVRRVFSEYTGGVSPRAIAVGFNKAGIPGPRGGKWTASLILGNAVRETGLLRNRLYVGERVWNRQHFVKDPTTGKRVARPNPREAWIISAAPQLQIVDRTLWEAAQQRLAVGRRQLGSANTDGELGSPADGANVGRRLAAARRPPWLLSGLVRCGVCNGPMGVVSSDGRLGCANRRERGTCSNPRTVLRARLLERVMAGLKHRLLAPELVEEFVRSFVAEVNAANRTRGQQRARLQQEHTKLGRQIRNLLELIKDGHGSPAMARELAGLESRQDQIVREIAGTGTPEPLPVLHPNLPELYRRKVDTLEEALRDAATMAAAAEALRSLVDAILVYPGETRGEVRVELRGDLAAFLYLPEPSDGAQTRTAASRKENGRSGGVMGTLVAGTGFEPVTFRL